MIQAILTHTPSWRAMLAGISAAVASSGLVAAASAMPGGNPDAELIRLCDEHPAKIAAFNLDEMDGDDSNPLWVAYTRSRDAIGAAKPVTMAGLLAKARAAKMEALMPDGSEEFRHSPAEDWAWNIVNDLLRLNGTVQS